MTPIIQASGLTKRFGDTLAVDSVDLSIAPGEIYGFLGLNGAGKTTTIRSLLGMIRPTRGSVRLFGVPVGPGGRGPWDRVGHMVEAPTAYPELSVRQNLEIAARLRGVNNRGNVSETIERFGLARDADRRAGTLSSGNLQRLGLARAFIHDPELVLLDEPASNLDPAGVVEIREFLRTFCRDQGATVFMSSHVLSEVDRLATRIGIIHKGRLIEELGTADLDRLRTHKLLIQARDPVAARAALQRGGYEISGEQADGSLVLEGSRALESPDEVAVVLVNAGTPPTRLALIHEDLEEHFLRLTGGLK